MAANAPIIILAIAMVVAVGVLAFGVGRILYGIAHYYLFERRPVREVHHPSYGLLTGEGELWTGIACINARQVHFAVRGTDSAPDDASLQRIDAIVGRFAELESRAVEFLRAEEAEVRKATFETYGLVVAEKNNHDGFTLEFLADGDDSRVWCVEFESGQPVRTGYDD